MSFKTLFAFVFSTFAFISMFLSSSAIACDDKACETAYLKTTQRYVDNKIRHAIMYRAERLAYAKNRERRALALYMHIHQTRFGRFHSGVAAKTAKANKVESANKVSTESEVKITHAIDS